MKLKVYGATFATLEVVLDIAANQRAMNQVLLTLLTNGEAEKYSQCVEALNTQVSKELALLRSRLIRHSEWNIDDALNGEIDF